MNDPKLDDYLKQGKRQSEAFFSADLSLLRKVVLHNINEPEKQAIRRPRWPALFKAGAAAACLVMAAGLFLALSHAPRPSEKAEQPVARQTVSLDGGSGDYMVSFQNVEKPSSQDPSLMSILWKLNGDDSQMVYNSLFEKSDEPYPVSIIAFPGDTESKMIMIASGYSKGSFLHYRLVEFTAGAAATLWSQNFVPQGKLGVQDGVVVEQRYNRSLETGDAEMQVSYIVPYVFDHKGTLYLPVEALKLRVGDQILLVGEQNDQKPLQASSRNGITKQVDETTEKVDHILVFQVSSSGEDVLQLKEGSSDKSLALKISE